MPPHSPSVFARLFYGVMLLFALIGVVLLAEVPLDLRSQCVFAVVLFVISLLVGRFKREGARQILIFLTLLVSTRYLWWRATETLGFSDPWSAAAGYVLFAAEVYAYIVLLLGYVQTIRPLRRKPVPLPDDPARWPTVDVFIPTYNEPLHVVAATVAAARNLEWPADKLQVYVLDDGNRAEFRRYAAQAGVNYRARKTNTGAKAGNLNEALAHSRGELVAVFDCDQIPVRSFLQLTVGWFLKDSRLAQLQTPQYFYTPDPLERNLGIQEQVPNEGSLFYGLIQDGNDLWNATYFCGSCAVMRRSSLESIGGIAEETVTEDAHTALKLHRRGFSSAYINEIQSAGMATDSLAAHVNQRVRWARGLAQVFRIDNPLFGRGLSLWQRLCYTNATMHFLYAAPRLVFLLAPLCFLLFDLSVIQAEAAMVAAMALPHIVQNNLTAARLSGHWRHAFWAEVYETVLSFYIFMPTLIALLMPSRGKFNVTEKGHSNEVTYFNYALARPFMIIGLLNILAMATGAYRYLVLQNAEPSTTFLNMFWAAYNLIIVGVALAIAMERRQTRTFQRHGLEMAACLTTEGGHRVSATSVDLSESGASVRLDKAWNALHDSVSDVQFVRLTLMSDDGPVSVPLKAVTPQGGVHRLTFDRLDVQQHRQLIGILYSTADRWVGARERFAEIGLLRSLARILRMSLVGWGRVVSGVGINRGALDKRSQSAASLCVLLGGLLMAALPSDGVQAQDAMDYEIRLLTDRIETPIELGLVRYGLDVPFAIRRDTVVNSAELHFVMSWEDRSESGSQRLQISLNDRTLWQATEPLAEGMEVSIPIDGVLLGEFNTLRFGLNHESGDECVAGSGESFQFTLHEASEIRMDVTAIPIANDLDTLPLPFFDDRDPRPATINLVLPSDASTATLLAAGRTAAWFGQLTSYRGVEFVASVEKLPQGDAVVVAAGDALPSSLAWLDTGEPRVLLLDSPDRPEQQLLVVTAPDDEGLEQAVNLLLATTDVADAADTQVASRQLDTSRPSRWLDTRVRHRIDQIPQLESARFDIVENNFSPIEVPFRLAGDFHSGGNKAHELVLNYFYEPDYPGFDETLYVTLNGSGLGEFSLADETAPSLLQRLSGTATRSNRFEGQMTLDIPHDLLRTDNRLEVRFSAPSSVVTGCGGAAATFVDAGIDPGSTLDLSDSATRARYPDLALFVNSGMPFTERADLSTTHIELPPSPDAHHYGLYLTLMGRFAAMTGDEPANVSVGTGATVGLRTHRIIIAGDQNLGRLNDALMQTPLQVSPDGLDVRFDSWQFVYRAISDWVNPLDVQHRLRALSREYDGANDALMVSALATDQRIGAVLVMMARTANAAAALQETLTDATRIRAVQNSAVVVGQEGLESVNVGRHWVTGQLPMLHTVLWWLSENLLALLLAVLVTALVFAFAVPRLLDGVAARRLQ